VYGTPGTRTEHEDEVQLVSDVVGVARANKANDTGDDYDVDDDGCDDDS
jgi:hypothetical protein